MDEPLYKVVFDGSLTGEFDEQTTREQFARLFRLDKKRVDRLFSGREYVIKRNIPEKTAMAFMLRLAEIGCECYIQEIPGEHEAEDDENIPADDRRKLAERRLRFRRGPRPGAIVPDRRLKIRRSRDKKRFLHLKQRQIEVPLAFHSYPVDAARD